MPSDIEFAGPERRRSGLTRSFSAWAAFLFGIHCISLSSSGFIPYSWVASVWPGASIVGVLTLALLCCMVHAIAYAVIGSTVSRTGADYVFSSRALSPSLGFAASWTLVIFSGVVAGGLAAWVPQSAIPALVRPMAILFSDHRYSLVADFATSSFGTIAIGWTIVALVTITVLRTNLFIQRIMTLGFVLGLLAWIVIIASLVTASGSEEFRTAWDQFMGPTGQFGGFDKRIELAKMAGMQVSGSTSTMTLAGLIMGFWIFYGYYIPTFFSEEVRNPTKTLFISSCGSLVFSYLIFACGAFLLQRLVSLEWIAAEGYLFNNPQQAAEAAGLSRVVAMPWITFYAAILNPRPVLILFVAFAWIFTLVNLVQTYFFYSSRIIYSWSLDRVVPDWILGPKGGDPSPNRSILIIACLALLGVVDSASGGPLGTQLTFVFFAVVTQLVPILALTLLPWLNREMFSRMPPAFSKKFAGVPLSSLIGAATLVYLCWMVVASFMFPATGVANPFGTIITLVLLVLSGFAVFYGMRAYRKKVERIDISYTYKTLEALDEQPRFE